MQTKSATARPPAREAHACETGGGETQAGDNMTYNNGFGAGRVAFYNEFDNGGSDGDPYHEWFETLRMKLIAEHYPISPLHSAEAALRHPAPGIHQVEGEEDQLECLPRGTASKTFSPADRLYDGILDLDGWDDRAKVDFESLDLNALWREYLGNNDYEAESVTAAPSRLELVFGTAIDEIEQGYGG